MAARLRCRDHPSPACGRGNARGTTLGPVRWRSPPRSGSGAVQPTGRSGSQPSVSTRRPTGHPTERTVVPAETHVEQGPMDRQAVLELIRDRLADILEIEPTEHQRGRLVRRRPRRRLAGADRAGRGPRGGARRAHRRVPHRGRGPRGPQDRPRRRRLRRREAGVRSSRPHVEPRSGAVWPPHAATATGPSRDRVAACRRATAGPRSAA